MSAKPSALALAAGLGIVAGMRSMAAPALLARHTPPRLARGPVSRLLAGKATTGILGIMAVGEMIADKLPFMPNRTDAPALAGRALMGAACGVAVAELWKGSRIGGGLMGAAGAVASSYAFFHLRRMADKDLGLPDTLVAVAEDAVVLAAGSRLARAAGA